MSDQLDSELDSELDRAADDTRRAALYASIVNDAPDFMVAFDHDLVVRLVGRSTTRWLGYEPSELEGKPATDFLHPDELSRALLQMPGPHDHGAPKGAAVFRLRHADGRWVPFDLTAAEVDDGVDQYFAVYCRSLDYQHATDEVLARLLDGADRAGALAPVLDVFSWRLNDASVAIAWHEPGQGHQYVSTGVPRELSGALEDPGAPWAAARASGLAQLDLDGSTLRPATARLAQALRRGGLWVVPITDAGSAIPALVTVWSRAGGPRPDRHGFGMQVANTYIELILQWASRSSLLEDAAHRDQLTKLSNRRALFHALEADEDPGALLFCDLDHFKPINDAHGHAAGDEVLRQIARRIEFCVRATDLVARSGGDEFVVLARGATPQQAAALAERIQAAIESPIEIPSAASPGGTTTVRVGVTIGLAHAPDHLDESTLRGADRALMTAKSDDRGSVRWHP